jgi:hypothetical protein
VRRAADRGCTARRPHHGAGARARDHRRRGTWRFNMRSLCARGRCGATANAPSARFRCCSTSTRPPEIVASITTGFGARPFFDDRFIEGDLDPTSRVFIARAKVLELLARLRELFFQFCNPRLSRCFNRQVSESITPFVDAPATRRTAAAHLIWPGRVRQHWAQNQHRRKFTLSRSATARLVAVSSAQSRRRRVPARNRVLSGREHPCSPGWEGSKTAPC